MPAQLLDGAAYAAEIRAEVTRQVAWFNAHHGPIKLCAVLVGSDAAGRLYAENQRKLSVQVGVQYELIERPETTTQAELAATLDDLNTDPAVTGIILQLPLPPHIEPALAQYRIDPYKDVEGVNPANIGLLFYGEPIIAPCTALAVTELIGRSGVPQRGADAVVVGQSAIVGRPVTMFLLSHMATVTGCHIATRDLAAHTRQADILVVAIGKPRAREARGRRHRRGHQSRHRARRRRPRGPPHRRRRGLRPGGRGRRLHHAGAGRRGAADGGDAAAKHGGGGDEAAAAEGVTVVLRALIVGASGSDAGGRDPPPTPP